MVFRLRVINRKGVLMSLPKHDIDRCPFGDTVALYKDN